MNQQKDKYFEKDRQFIQEWIALNYPKYINKYISFKIVNKHLCELINSLCGFDEKLFKTYTKYLNFLNLNLTLLKCKNCGSYLPYKYITTTKKHEYCSIKCSMPDKLKKIQQHNMQVYGVKNVFQADCIKEKIKKTMVERHGVEHPIQNTEINERRKKTLVEHYGVEHPIKNLQIKNKIKNTCKERYGQTSYTKTQQYKDKIKNISLEKYNCLNHEFLDKWQHMNMLQQATPMFSLSDIENQASKKYYKFKCNYCNNIFLSMWKNGQLTNHCNCLKQKSSMRQKQLQKFCRQYIPDILTNSKKLIFPYQLDIYSPSLLLAIEFNGIYWHNKNKKQKNYHLKKTQLCEKKGIHLIHIWEDDWVHNKAIIKEKLISIFNNKLIIDDLNSDILILDRCWFQYKKIINIYDKTYILEKITQPKLCKNNCYNCGQLIYKRLL